MGLVLYISSCHKAHKALTFSFNPLRFAAKALTVIHDCHPATGLSSSTILLHVVFGRPGLLLPSGLHSNAVTQCSSLFFLIICPIQFHLRRLISSLVLFTPVVSRICWCEMVLGHLIVSMRLMHLYWIYICCLITYASERGFSLSASGGHRLISVYRSCVTTMLMDSSRYLAGISLAVVTTPW